MRLWNVEHASQLGKKKFARAEEIYGIEKNLKTREDKNLAKLRRREEKLPTWQVSD